MKNTSFISKVFWRYDHKWAFQKVDNGWILYNDCGEYVRYFTSFQKMCEYMDDVD